MTVGVAKAASVIPTSSFSLFLLFFVFILFCPAGGKGPSYPFGIMGMANKGDCLQKGEFVKFQVCTVSQTGQKMACNVVPQRRAVVECVKDQVCLISLAKPLPPAPQV